MNQKHEAIINLLEQQNKKGGVASRLIIFALGLPGALLIGLSFNSYKQTDKFILIGIGAFLLLLLVLIIGAMRSSAAKRRKLLALWRSQPASLQRVHFSQRVTRNSTYRYFLVQLTVQGVSTAFALMEQDFAVVQAYLLEAYPAITPRPQGSVWVPPQQ